MRCSLMSIAALGFASIALAAPASLQQRGHGKGGLKVVVETVTVTEIVYTPQSSYVPEPIREEPTPTPEPAPEDTPTPKPIREEPTPTPYAPEPTPTPSPEPLAPYKPVPNVKPKPKTTTSPLPPSPTNPPSDNLSDFERMYVEKHNELRAKTGAGPLTLDRTIADYAQNHVQSCVFEHSSPHVYGENLGAGYPTIADTIQAWYDEWTKYDFSNPNFSSASGHFTQVVWKAATKIGCGQKVCNGANGTPGTYFSCNYNAGNLIGSFGDNVGHPTS